MNNVIPPQSVEAEQSILGAMMTSPNCVDDVIGSLSESDFYRHDHKLIYQAITEINIQNQPIDVLTVSEKLDRNSQLEQCGGLSALGTMAKNTPSVKNVMTYANIVKDKSGKRKVIELAKSISDMSYEDGSASVDDIINLADRGIQSILDKSTSLGAKHIKDYAKNAVDELEERNKRGNEFIGVPTGFIDLDRSLLGLEDGEVVIIAARPGMGKTAFALNIAHHIATNGNNCLFLSLEMPVKQLINRMWAKGGVDHGAIRNGSIEPDDWPKITSGLSDMVNSGLFVDDTPSLTVPQVSAIAKKVIKKHGKMPIFIDYLQIMRGDEKGKSSYEETTQISKGLKAIAKTLDVPIVVLSQLSRSLESRADKRPKPSDLRDSGAIEQDASVIMFLYREEQYTKSDQTDGLTEVIVAKNRNGSSNETILLGWQGQYQRFNNLDELSKKRYQSATSNKPDFKQGLK